MAEQHAEQAGAEEAGEQAAEEARPIEEAANGRGYRRALRERAARLARLRHAALDGPHARRCRRRGRRRKCLRAATTETSAATGARIGVGHREGQHRRHGAKRKQRTKAQAKHGVLPERPFGSTQILVSHGGIVRGAAWCRSPLPPSHLAAAWILIGSFYSARPRESGDRIGTVDWIPAYAGMSGGLCPAISLCSNYQKIRWCQSSSPSAPGSAIGRARSRCSSSGRHRGAANRRGATEPVIPGSRLIAYRAARAATSSPETACGLHAR